MKLCSLERKIAAKKECGLVFHFAYDRTSIGLCPPH